MFHRVSPPSPPRPVARPAVPRTGHLRGHVQGVLRGLRHLQLPGVPAQLPQQPVPEPGADAGGAAAAAAPAAALLLPAVAHGRVRGGAGVGRAGPHSEDGAKAFTVFPVSVRVLLFRCKLGVLQYTVVRPVTTVVAL